jgi:TRAP-type mannitol/chloroaromatic compound transport system permease large subunit
MLIQPEFIGDSWAFSFYLKGIAAASVRLMSGKEGVISLILKQVMIQCVRFKRQAFGQSVTDHM